jgi:hypothetical protein
MKDVGYGFPCLTSCWTGGQFLQMASTSNDDNDATRRARVYLLTKLWKLGERPQALVSGAA